MQARWHKVMHNILWPAQVKDVPAEGYLPPWRGGSNSNYMRNILLLLRCLPRRQRSLMQTLKLSHTSKPSPQRETSTILPSACPSCHSHGRDDSRCEAAPVVVARLESRLVKTGENVFAQETHFTQLFSFSSCCFCLAVETRKHIVLAFSLFHLFQSLSPLFLTPKLLKLNSLRLQLSRR